MILRASIGNEDANLVNVENIHKQLKTFDMETAKELTITEFIPKEKSGAQPPSCGPISFADPRDPLPEKNPCPPPKYFSYDTLLKPLPMAKEDILAG